EHLVFVDDEQGRSLTANEAALLSFQGRNDNRRVQILGKVTRRDADIPTASAPFSQFIVCESPGGNGVDGLPAILSLIRPKLKNEGFARTRRGVHNHILAFPKSCNSLLLPHIRNDDLVE